MSTRLESYLSRAVLDRAPRRTRKPRKRGMLALTLQYVKFPVRDEKYKSWVRTLPCLICGSIAEAAHTGDDGGKALKASDHSCVPLCHRCHRTGPRAYHRIGRRAFERFHMIDFSAIVLKLNAEYERR